MWVCNNIEFLIFVHFSVNGNSDPKRIIFVLLWKYTRYYFKNRPKSYLWYKYINSCAHTHHIFRWKIDFFYDIELSSHGKWLIDWLSVVFVLFENILFNEEVNIACERLQKGLCLGTPWRGASVFSFHLKDCLI